MDQPRLVEVVALGKRRDGTSRGVWCGMGVCQECIVTVHGVPSRRANEPIFMAPDVDRVADAIGGMRIFGGAEDCRRVPARKRFIDH